MIGWCVEERAPDTISSLLACARSWSAAAIALVADD